MLTEILHVHNRADYPNPRVGKGKPEESAQIELGIYHQTDDVVHVYKVDNPVVCICLQSKLPSMINACLLFHRHVR